MEQVDVQELREHASAVVEAAGQGRPVLITDRGRAVAQLDPVAASPLAQLRAAGRVREATLRLGDLPQPEPAVRGASSISETLEASRGEERY